MELFITLIIGLFIIAIIIYAPYFYQCYVAKKAENDFQNEFNSYKREVQRSYVIVLEEIGKGTSNNSDIRFVEAHKNQDFAINSINGLLEEWRLNFAEEDF